MKYILKNPANPLAMLLMALAMALAFLACEEKGKQAVPGGEQVEDKQMTLAIAGSDVTLYLEGAGWVNAISWGDGTVGSLTLNTKSDDEHYNFTYPDYEKFKISHTYKESALYTITIRGGNITAFMVSSGVSSLDVSKNTVLKYLNVSSNQLTNLDVSKNTALTYLNVSSNQLTNLDVSENTALTYLNVSGNQLTNLDVSKNTALKYLDCDGNQLTNLDVSKNTEFEELYCSNNQLTNLDVSKKTALKTLYCSGNQLTNLNLDMTSNAALTYLNINDNKLTGTALDALFKTLHKNAGEKEINISGNPGTGKCDMSIATKKGWQSETELEN